ncbi:LysE family translocator [Vibrio neptunius]|uniref:LysE family translocator n=1 Tax=Vibrio neptunius TaxID=170651 RepID=UPI0019D21FE0|nr:LysE family translocator [Vibrio neptunius]MBN3573948.1 LysE family translocator [Vibrio neptunius]QXX09182.1 LysE family translocator [Vibrio neptunius]
MEFVSLAVLGFFIVISPGADFVLVLRNSIQQGRAAGVWTAIGISTAITVHIAYSILGIGYLISQNLFLFQCLKYLGAAYLIYLGIKGFLSSSHELEQQAGIENHQAQWRYALQGWLCNALNPKTMLFFVSIFSQVISPNGEEMTLALLYGGYMILLHGLWFGLVAVLLTSPTLQTRLLKLKKRLEQACGIALVSFGALLATKA